MAAISRLILSLFFVKLTVSASYAESGNDIILNQDQIPEPPELRELETPPPLKRLICPMYKPNCLSQRGILQQECFCDAFCAIRNDCCEDYRPYKREDHVTRESMLAYMQCTESNKYGIPVRIAVLRQCPKDHEYNMVRSLCEEPSDDDQFLNWPVSGKYNGIMYNNIYCSMCWKERSPLFWKLRSHIKGSVEASPDSTPEPNPNFQQFLKVSTSRFLTPFHTAANQRLCDEVYISMCPSHVTNQDGMLTRCAGKTAIVYAYNDVLGEAIYYKNEHCALCNGIKPEAIRCIEPPLFRQEISYDRGTGLTVLFDMNAGSVVNEGLWTSGFEGMNMTCPQGQIFDLFNTECRPLFCKDNEIYHDKSCYPDNSTFMPDCTTILIPPKDFIESDNGSIHLKGTITYLNASEYHRLNDSILVCKDAVIFDEISLYKLTGFITIIGSSISCISLLILLIVYSLLPKLRNIPGKVTMGLSFSLLMAQLLFLIGVDRTEIREICTTFAILIHYFFLSAFSWMFLLSLDLTLTFRPNNTRGIVRKQTGRFLKYALYAFLFPALVVVTGIVLDFVPSSKPYNPGYGQRQCWFSNQLSLLLLFLLPASIHIISNIVMFVYTVYNVCRATKAVQMVRPVDECRVFLYLKLSIIMGTTWILVYVWLLTHEYVVEILFVIFNSLQGLFICLVFVCRSKTYSLLKSRITGVEVSRDVTPSTKRTSLSATEKSGSLLRGGRKSKQDLWIEMHGDHSLAMPINGRNKSTV